MNIRDLVKRNNLVSYVLAALIVFLFAVGVFQIRRRNS